VSPSLQGTICSLILVFEMSKLDSLTSGFRGCLFSERAPRASGFGQHSASDPLRVKMDNDDPVAVEWENMKTWVPRAEKDFWQCVHSHMCSLCGHMCSLSVCCLKKILHIFYFLKYSNL
jgi:hypothetical protein